MTHSLDNNIVSCLACTYETRQQTDNKRNKIAKLKSVFFLLEKNCFQSHESQQLSTNIRISARLFFFEKTNETGLLYTEIHMTRTTKYD